VLQCSGNGRAFFDHETSGTQWSVGAAGNVVWTGVPVRDVVAAMGGVADGMDWLTGTGGEEIPEGVPKETIQVERSVPKAAMERAILAWEMNGQPVPLAHGGPLRLVIPGYYGVNNVKYLKRLAFTEKESPNKIQQTSYRVRPVGEKGAPSQPSMFEMNVKSWITGPLEDAETGKVQIHGVAMGGTETLEKVEVSTDGGQSWNEAQFLGPDMGPYAWRPFVLIADLGQGSHLLASRATTVGGQAQPEEVEPNERGYGHNGWRAHAVDVTVL
jgi:sulfite oxidase